MRTPDGHLCLIDFGIARHFYPGKLFTEPLGTEGYAAPEQYRKGEPATLLSDMYGLGAILHHLLTGNDPSTNKPTFFDFPPIPSVPSELETLIMQMLEKHSQNRPVSARIVKQELQRIAALLPKPPSQPAPPQPKPVVPLPLKPQPPLPAKPAQPSPAPQPVVPTPHIQPQQNNPLYAGNKPAGIAPIAPSNQPQGQQKPINQPVPNVQPAPSPAPQKVPLAPLQKKQSPNKAPYAFPRRTFLTGMAAVGLSLLGYGAYKEFPHVRHAFESNPETYTTNPGGVVNDAVWSPNGRYIAVANGAVPHELSGTSGVQIWDTEIDSAIYTEASALPVVSVSWSPDGSRLASASTDGTSSDVHIRDTLTGAHGLSIHVSVPGEKSHAMNSVDWSPDGKLIALASHVKYGNGTKGGVMQVREAATGRLITSRNNFADGVNEAKWSPDGKRLALSCDDGSVQLWSVRDGAYSLERTVRFNSPVSSSTWSADGKHMASVYGSLCIWDTTTGEQLTTSDVGGGFASAAWSPNGTRLASGSGHDVAFVEPPFNDPSTIWDGKYNFIDDSSNNTGQVNKLSWSPDSKRLAESISNGTVRVWTPN